MAAGYSEEKGQLAGLEDMERSAQRVWCLKLGWGCTVHSVVCHGILIQCRHPLKVSEGYVKSGAACMKYALLKTR